MSDNAKKRFVDAGVRIQDLMDEIWVHCPRCDKCAIIRQIGENNAGFGPCRIVCGDCGYSKDWEAASHRWPRQNEEIALDPYLECKLWLQRRCAGHTLWALNKGHLRLMRDFVSAEFRTTKKPSGCCCHPSLASSLPKWICESKNREAILETLAELEQKLDRSRA